ncbi:nitrile hydratase accessory protein [Rhizobiales bacterium]|uniref:nitrile hydratase accessory protein n=1 Tax=Hongsoonwoonella zoysiae TaxID=2821844 RepID=UPI00155FDA58|nr:nitrile hydratase accessory protein [Hongsoonwoonella zoysiae]NRG16636.1 nitrile hydratase accessory protein [Hongsoonwoonella zoysiae]
MAGTGSLPDFDPLSIEIACGQSDHVDAPKFAQPWHAQAFGTSMALSRAGLFTWAEWVETFSTIIRNVPPWPGEDSNSTYYRQWETALETILLKKGILGADEISQAAEDWRRSYLATPHGHPVEFRRGLEESIGSHGDEGHDHHHHHHHDGRRPEPIAVSPARLAAAG